MEGRHVTAEEIAEIRALHAATSPGWRGICLVNAARDGADFTPEEFGELVRNAAQLGVDAGRTKMIALKSANDLGDEEAAIVAIFGNGPTSAANTRFAERIHEATPRLLAHIDVLEAANREMRSALESGELDSAESEHIAYQASRIAALEAENGRLKGTRMFPIQGERVASPHPTQIPWSVAELAYSVYAARYGRGQSLERLAERGGFAPSEMDKFLPDWRTRCEEIGTLREENARLRAACASVFALISESRGVAGLHLNGDEASWDSLLCGPFSEWLEKLDQVRSIVEEPAR